MKNKELEQKIINTLSALEPTFVELIDESHKHIGHAGVKEHGGKHYALTITSQKFKNLSLIKRHQLIYDTLVDFMKKDIHALKIKAKIEN